MRDAETQNLIDRLQAQLERAREDYDAATSGQADKVAYLETENRQLREMLARQRNTIGALQAELKSKN